MIAADEDALMCDLMETYGIVNFRELPVKTLAALALGLKEGSRIKKKINNEKVDADSMLLAAITDRLSTLVWFQSTDGAKNINRPASILNALLGKEKESPVISFESGEAFEKAKKQILGEF